MPTPALQTDILKLEKQYWDALAKRDPTALKALTGDTFLMTMSEGIFRTPGNEFVDSMLGDDMKLRSYGIDEPSVQVLAPRDDFAIIAYKSHTEFDNKGDRESSDSYFTSTWLRDGSTWKCIAGCASEANEP